MAYYYYYSGGGRRGGPSVLETLSLYPVPYPVLVILAVVMLLLGASSFMSYEEAVEEAGEQLSWALMAVPILLVLAIRGLSAVETQGLPFGFLSPYDRRRRAPGHYWYGGGGGGGEEGSSPWGVLALVVLLLVLLSFQSSFREMWLI